MKLSISNIGWDAQDDLEVYRQMRKYGFSGLEVAPTRVFPECPYGRLGEAGAWSRGLRDRFGLVVPSMQSIWFGRQESMFGTWREREALSSYTRQAVGFACAIGCGNLVFGCPRNRNLPEGADRSGAVPFFKELGDYASAHGTAIGIEANPTIYHTNYINSTAEALELVSQVGSKGILLNLDVGTMLQNREPVSVLEGKVGLINHVHISEPGLKPVERRGFHQDLARLLREEGYGGFVSIEMGRAGSLAVLEGALEYVGDVFAG